MGAVEFAFSLANDYQAHLTLIHVIEGILRDSPHVAMQLTERRLRDLVPSEPELQYAAEVMAELGPVTDRILGVATELAADIIVMGVRGAGALGDMASHFGSIADKIVSHATCPVLTVGVRHEPENE
jgi:nucleotide-binding universal stress UspA family protein